MAVPGVGLEGVHCLRSVTDADTLHPSLVAKPKVVVIRAEWIGAEVAASSGQLGHGGGDGGAGIGVLDRVLDPEGPGRLPEPARPTRVELHFVVMWGLCRDRDHGVRAPL